MFVESGLYVCKKCGIKFLPLPTFNTELCYLCENPEEVDEIVKYTENRIKEDKC